MKATIIGNRDEMSTVKTKAAVLSFRPKLEDFLVLSTAGVKIIQISPAANKTLSKGVRTMLNNSKFKMSLVVGSIQGIRKDVHGKVIDIDIPSKL